MNKIHPAILHLQSLYLTGWGEIKIEEQLKRHARDTSFSKGAVMPFTTPALTQMWLLIW